MRFDVFLMVILYELLVLIENVGLLKRLSVEKIINNVEE